ncbi:MAG: tetratricopeptide repeat protein [Gammaproteobacteria bacterium]|nr:tetratricopeptide repeat protein [Gammaproteobacteria bacterium]
MVNKLKLQLTKLMLIAGTLAILTGCAIIDLDTQFTSDPELYNRVITQSSDQFATVSPLYISDEIKHYVDAVVGPRLSSRRKVELLQDLLFGEEYLDIKYSDFHTQTAVELFNSRSGNCLSVINLYVAIARYLDLDASFQTVQVRPYWDRRGSVLVLSQHINASGKINQRNSYVVDFTPEIALQQLTSEIVSDTQARALYFNNLGVEQMIAGELEAAMVYMKNALWIDPQMSIGWNNIGAVLNRLGEKELAEFSYQMAFDVDATNATAISNLARFYIEKGDEGRARSYLRAIDKFNKKNPYYHFNLGNFSFASGDLEGAVEHYRRAIKIKQLEPDFYTALAQAYAQTGDTRLQQRMQAEASELLAQNQEIFQPSDNKLRIIDSQSILRPGSPGLSVIAN